MKKFMFSSREIDAHASDRAEWHNFVRRREAEMAFSMFPGLRFGLALELGAGDGGQSATISRYCDWLICTERDERSHAWLGQTILQTRLPNVDYRLCDARDLSQFDDCTFDLVFSSNMLEHVPDVSGCLDECRRVLREDGLMLHTMPSRWWKLFTAGLTMLKRRLPAIHGVSASHWEELLAFGSARWRRLIERHALAVNQVVGLPFYVGVYSRAFVPVIKAGNALGIPASFLYVIRKTRKRDG